MDEYFHISLSHTAVRVGVGSRVISSLCCGSVWFHAFDPCEASGSGGEGNRCEAGRLVAVQMASARGCCCLLMLASNTHTHTHAVLIAYRTLTASHHTPCLPLIKVRSLPALPLGLQFESHVDKNRGQ